MFSAKIPANRAYVGKPAAQKGTQSGVARQLRPQHVKMRISIFIQCDTIDVVGVYFNILGKTAGNRGVEWREIQMTRTVFTKTHPMQIESTNIHTRGYRVWEQVWPSNIEGQLLEYVLDMQARESDSGGKLDLVVKLADAVRLGRVSSDVPAQGSRKRH
ncbi:hypothetical protein B0H19DRAFT_1066744 [Mycena capillaripes]|nr:hypothetical protein B0H19DRAFT_1066744 [Mycena capillaripes]